MPVVPGDVLRPATGLLHGTSVSGCGLSDRLLLSHGREMRLMVVIGALKGEATGVTDAGRINASCLLQELGGWDSPTGGDELLIWNTSGACATSYASMKHQLCRATRRYESLLLPRSSIACLELSRGIHHSVGAFSPAVPERGGGGDGHGLWNGDTDRDTADEGLVASLMRVNEFSRAVAVGCAVWLHLPVSCGAQSGTGGSLDDLPSSVPLGDSIRGFPAQWGGTVPGEECVNLPGGRWIGASRVVMTVWSFRRFFLAGMALYRYTQFCDAESFYRTLSPFSRGTSEHDATVAGILLRGSARVDASKAPADSPVMAGGEPAAELIRYSLRRLSSRPRGTGATKCGIAPNAGGPHPASRLLRRVLEDVLLVSQFNCAIDGGYSGPQRATSTVADDAAAVGILSDVGSVGSLVSAADVGDSDEGVRAAADQVATHLGAVADDVPVGSGIHHDVMCELYRIGPDSPGALFRHLMDLTELFPTSDASHGAFSVSEVLAPLCFLYGLSLREAGYGARAIAAFLASCHMDPLLWSAWVDLARLLPIPACESMMSLSPGYCRLSNTGGAWLRFPAHWGCLYPRAIMSTGILDTSSALLNRCSIRIATRGGGRLFGLSTGSGAAGKPEQGGLTQQLILVLCVLFPHHAGITAMVASALYGAHDMQRSLACFEQAYVMDPYLLEFVDNFSNLLYVLDMGSRLAQLARNVVALRPHSCSSFLVLGNHFSLLGDHRKSIECFSQAVAVEPSSANAWTLLGHEYVNEHNIQAALLAYGSAVECNTMDFRAWYGLGQLYELLKLYSYASYFYRRACEYGSRDVRPWAALGHVLLLRAAALDPGIVPQSTDDDRGGPSASDSGSLPFTVGNIQHGVPRAVTNAGLRILHAATRCLERALTIDARDAAIANSLAQLYQQCGQFHLAARAFTLSLSLITKSTAVWSSSVVEGGVDMEVQPGESDATLVEASVIRDGAAVAARSTAVPVGGSEAVTQATAGPDSSSIMMDALTRAATAPPSSAGQEPSSAAAAAASATVNPAEVGGGAAVNRNRLRAVRMLAAYHAQEGDGPVAERYVAVLLREADALSQRTAGEVAAYLRAA